jgi:hypothetical protein
VKLKKVLNLLLRCLSIIISLPINYRIKFVYLIKNLIQGKNGRELEQSG